MPPGCRVPRTELQGLEEYKLSSAKIARKDRGSRWHQSLERVPHRDRVATSCAALLDSRLVHKNSHFLKEPCKFPISSMSTATSVIRTLF